MLSRVRGANSDTARFTDKDTLESAIVGYLNVLGEEKVNSLVSKCDFYNNDGEDDEEPNGTYNLSSEGDTDTGEEDTAT